MLPITCYVSYKTYGFAIIDTLIPQADTSPDSCNEIADHFHEPFAIRFQFERTNAIDLRELLAGDRLIRTISRNVLSEKTIYVGFTEFAGDVKPQRTQFGEQFLVSVARHIRSHGLRATDGDSARFAARFRSIFLIS